MMSAEDLFASAIGDETRLRELYEEPTVGARHKDIGHMDEMCRRLIGACRLVLVGSYDAQGRCDVTPRGGPAGFVAVLDEHHLALPDATGNRRLDTLANVVQTGEAALLFLIGGRETTLRVNGAACVSEDPELLARLSPVGKPPRTALVVRVREAYAHCPKAFIRSALWDPSSWSEATDLPTAAEVSLAHRRPREPALTLAEVEHQQQESVRTRLA
ncbi:MAG TPA: MSMEG_1061 family FMN-dependent PPOX-type flavoprotein [Solirubrobacteraceae bacterium]|jgi:hypothetical protein|nr:MSMEG_1061 family FMN-dependent PPOX-type flavoprotein [Solirubrobacteraceae bacterium]